MMIFYSATENSCVPAKAEMLKSKKQRTLLFGYTPDRNAFHVYLDRNKKIVRLIYALDGILINSKTEDDVLTLSDCVPFGTQCQWLDDGFHSVLVKQKVLTPKMYLSKSAPDGLGRKFEELLTSHRPHDFVFDLVVQASDLGLDLSLIPDVAHLEAWLTAKLNEHASGFMRAYVIDGKESAEPWLSSLSHLVKAYVNLNYNADLPENFTEKLDRLCLKAKSNCFARNALLAYRHIS